MSDPVSEENERAVATAIVEACERALSDTEEGGDGAGSEAARLSAEVRGSEREDLGRALSHVRREADALDLKEYYHERRLMSLGLDSEWSLEDDGYGREGRVSGGVDYDW